MNRDGAPKHLAVPQARSHAGHRQGVLTAWPWTLDEFEQFSGERYDGAATAWPFTEDHVPAVGSEERQPDAGTPQS